MIRTPYYKILVDGEDLSDDVYNKITKVQFKEPEEGEQYFTIYMEDQDYSIQDSEIFTVDKTIGTLYMGYIDDYDMMMNGIVQSISPDYPESGTPTLEVVVKNVASVMNREEKNYRFVDKTYSDIAIEKAKQYGLKPNVDDTSYMFDPKKKRKTGTTHGEDVDTTDYANVYQTGKSDYDFLKALAKKIGFRFYIDSYVLHFRKDFTKEDKIALEYRVGDCNLLQFKPNINVANAGKKFYSENVDFEESDTADESLSTDLDGDIK